MIASKTYITASIVLYKEEKKELLKAIKSILQNDTIAKFYLIDNSPNNFLRIKVDDPRVSYIRTNKNVGFGVGHNIILDKIENESDYHLILNPDVEFESDVIDKLVEQFDKDDKLSLVAPKVLFPNNELQYTARKYPSIIGLLLRFLKISNNYTRNKEYRNLDLNKPLYPDFIQGSFLLFKTEDFVKIGGFDERYFLYMEDVDICRKIDEIGKKKMYYPKVHIHHVLKKGSSKSFKLFIRHIISMIKYFLKWGF